MRYTLVQTTSHQLLSSWIFSIMFSYVRTGIMGLCVLGVCIASGCSSKTSTELGSGSQAVLDIKNISQEALSYNNMIINIHTEVVTAYNSYITALSDTSTGAQTTIQQNLNKAIQTSEDAQKKINLIGDFQGDPSFVEATKAYLSGIRDILVNEETQFVGLYTTGVAKDEHTTAMLSGLEHKIQSKLESIDSAYKQVQINFAQTYKFKLQEEQDNPIPEDESKMQESLPDIKNMLESDSNTDLPQ